MTSETVSTTIGASSLRLHADQRVVKRFRDLVRLEALSSLDVSQGEWSSLLDPAARQEHAAARVSRLRAISIPARFVSRACTINRGRRVRRGPKRINSSSSEPARIGMVFSELQLVFAPSHFVDNSTLARSASGRERGPRRFHRPKELLRSRLAWNNAHEYPSALCPAVQQQRAAIARSLG